MRRRTAARESSPGRPRRLSADPFFTRFSGLSELDERKRKTSLDMFRRWEADLLNPFLSPSPAACD
jgi:hypothetical protein